MDRRSWPWKRKSSEKASSASDSSNASLSNSDGKQGEQENNGPVSFMQISVEKYEHFNALEEQVEIMNKKLNDLNEKLSSAHEEMITKEELVKQHAKVAEEAISGWEKAEAETLALKHQLESVTLLKLTAEDRASQLDNALKECLKEIRSVKEEDEQKLQDVIFAKTRQWEKIKSELEASIAAFEGELLNCSAETAALSRSLQERSALLMKVSDEKVQADAEIDLLKASVQSRDREVSSLKYELNIAAKELEIRNEEKNMSVKSAEAANKQHVEDIKKITKLEAECQRLRGLMRKKLPGPAALAQMKLEVESFGQDHGESRVRGHSGKSLSPYPAMVSEVSFHEVEHYQKENEFLTARLLAMEEETKLLKEALSKRNSELHASRSMCANVANKLRSFEVQMLSKNQQKNTLKSNASRSFEGSLCKNQSHQSLASMSEDGVDDGASCTESWASTLMLEPSQPKKAKDYVRSKITHDSNQLELMDDFLEMERLAGLSSENSGTIIIADELADTMKAETSDEISSVDVHMDVCKEQMPDSKQSTCVASLNFNPIVQNLLSKLQERKERIASVVTSKVIDFELGNIMKEITNIMQDAQNELNLHYNDHLIKEAPPTVGEVSSCETSLKHNEKSCSEMEKENTLNQELRSSIHMIHSFVASLSKVSSEDHTLNEELKELSSSVDKFLCDNSKLNDFVLSLSRVLKETERHKPNKTWDMGENNGNDCIDKVTLLENGVACREPMEGKLSELKAVSRSIPAEGFEHWKIERDNMEVELVNCREHLESVKLQLAEAERNLAELKMQLSACQKSKDLAETQLRCMTESYKLLESRKQELETEANLLTSKAEALDIELSECRHSYQEILAKYNDMQEQISNTRCSKCSNQSDSDAETKARQEREIAAAAEKLAVCQETILLLSKQLNTLRSPAAPTSMTSHSMEEPNPADDNTQQHSHQHPTNAMEGDAAGVELPLDEYTSHLSASDMELSPAPKSNSSSRRPKQQSRSSSSSSLSSMINEKQGRGIGRFFSK